MDDVELVLDALARLAAGRVRVGARPIVGADVECLHPDEMAVVASAVQRRREEFATGRVLLHQLIGSTSPILPGPTRAPLLPPGVVASLAHDRSLAVAAVGGSSAVRAVGIDVEPTERLHPDLARSILRPDERDIDAHLAFTVKEAAYKAWSVLGGRIIDHQEVRLSGQGSTYRANVVAAGWDVEVEWAAAGGRYLALAVVEIGHSDIPSGVPDRGATHDGV